jgi:ketosteroid isomerase-like protein
MIHTDIGQAVLARERQALDRWSAGDPAGYVTFAAEDISYFDDIGAQARLDGIGDVRAYLASLDGKIPPHRYEVVEPRVQLCDDVAVLTFRYHPYGPDGQPLTRWKATTVYRRDAGEWWTIHAHWSMLKEA